MCKSLWVIVFTFFPSFPASPLSVAKGTIAVETCVRQLWSWRGDRTFLRSFHVLYIWTWAWKRTYATFLCVRNLSTWGPRGLIYNRCVRTKRGWKLRTWLFTPRLWSIKNQLDGKMCAALSKLWPMRTHGLEGKENWRHRRCGGELKSDRRIAEWEERLCFIIALHKFNFNPYNALNPNLNNLNPLRYFSVITPEISP